MAKPRAGERRQAIQVPDSREGAPSLYPPTRGRRERGLREEMKYASIIVPVSGGREGTVSASEWRRRSLTRDRVPRRDLNGLGIE